MFSKKIAFAVAVALLMAVPLALALGDSGEEQIAAAPQELEITDAYYDGECIVLSFNRDTDIVSAHITVTDSSGDTAMEVFVGRLQVKAGSEYRLYKETYDPATGTGSPVVLPDDTYTVSVSGSNPLDSATAVVDVPTLYEVTVNQTEGVTPSPSGWTDSVPHGTQLTVSPDGLTLTLVGEGKTYTAAETADRDFHWEIVGTSGNTVLVSPYTVTGPVTVQAVWTQVTYEITWKDYDDTVLRTDSVASGTVPSYGSDPVRESTAQYSYEFGGWSPAVTAATGDATYKATYTQTLRTYTVTWENHDGTVLETDTDVPYGTAPVYNGSTPSKDASAQYTYTFTGWDPTVADVTGDATYTAQFSSAVNTYKVTWKNHDGSVLETDSGVPYGTVPSYDGSKPAKAADAEFTYSFSGWDPEVSAVTGDAEYTAQFSSEVNTYKVTWKNHDGTVLETDSAVAYGTMPEYNGSTPSKDADAQFTYTFDGWNPTVAEVTGEAVYTAKFSSTVNTYTVTWKNHDGSVLETDTDVPYGTMPEYNGKTPVKAADTQNTYTFSGWDPEVSAVTGDAEYTAQFSSDTNTYTVTWVNHDGTELEKDQNVPYGTEPSYDGATPVKEPTAQYTYTHSGWSPVPSPVKGDVTYTAVFDQTVRTYTVKWMNGDVLLKEDTVAYGKVPAYTGETPVKEPTVQYTYTFTGWDPAATAVKGDQTYTAVFDQTLRSYTVKWMNGDILLETDTVEYGKVPVYSGETPVKEADVQFTYTFSGWDPEVVEVTGDATYSAEYSTTVNQYDIRFLNWNGQVLQEGKVAYGEKPVYSGDVPVREQTAESTYTFSGWDPEVVEVTGAADYTAKFDAETRTYTVTWTDEDGSVLATEQVAYGTVPEYSGTEPTKEQTAEYTYTFSGWEPETSAVTGDQTYRAVYESALRIYSITAPSGLVGGTVTVAGEAANTSKVRIKVTVDRGYELTSLAWNGNQFELSGAGTYTFDMPAEDVTVTAGFTEIVITEIVLGETSKVLTVGGSFVLTATYSPEDALNGRLVWSLSEEGIVSLDGETVTAVSAGTAVITVSAESDPSVKAECTVTVKEAAPVGPVLKSLTVSGTYRTEYWVGDSLDLTGLTVTASYSDGRTADVTSDSTFSPTKFQQAGKTAVKVTYRGVQTSFDVNVYEKPLPPVDTDVPVEVVGGKVSDEASEEAIRQMEEIRKENPNAVPQVSFESADSETVELPMDLLDAVIDNGGELTVSTPAGSVKFSAEALSGQSFPAGKTVKVCLKESEVPSKHQEFVGDGSVIEVFIEVDGNKVTTVFGEEVSLKVRYELPAGKDASDLRVYYLADDGTTEEMPGAAYSSEDGTGYVTFQTMHFSMYAVKFVEETDPEPIVPEPEQPEDGTDWMPIAAAVLAVLVIVIVAAVVLKNRRA